MISEWERLTAGGAVVLAGFHAVKHALRFGADLRLLVTTDPAAALGLAGELAPDVADSLRDRLTEVDAATFARLVPSGHHTGVAGLAVRPRWAVPDPRVAPLVLLDDPRHLGNYGAVIRVAAGLGASGVVSTGSVDPWQPAVVRGAAGLQFALPVLRLPGATEDGSGGAVAAGIGGPVLAFDGAGRDARGVRIPDDAVLAFGSERRGLSRELLERADDVLALPMRPGVASYNLASAVAMALYQWSLSRT